MSTESEYQAVKIKKALSELSSLYWDLEFMGDIALSEDEHKYRSASIKDNFEFIADRLYVSCVAYIESKNLPLFLVKFDEAIKPYYSDKKLMLSGHYDEDSGETYSAFTAEYWKFLSAFYDFRHEDNEELKRRFGLTYLEHILESTSVILKERGIVPTSEHQVYEAVKLVTQATFPNITFPSSPFISTAKCYIPDILIPSLNCAIEYKYRHY